MDIFLRSAIASKGANQMPCILMPRTKPSRRQAPPAPSMKAATPCENVGPHSAVDRVVAGLAYSAKTLFQTGRRGWLNDPLSLLSRTSPAKGHPTIKRYAALKYASPGHTHRARFHASSRLASGVGRWCASGLLRRVRLSGRSRSPGLTR